MLDAADVLLNGAPAAFEHIVVDEAQDLSPMQLEAIRRRSRAGSMTLLGDLAQGTSPWAHTSWEEVALHLRRKTVPTQIAELASSYRLPAEVHEVAMRLLPAIAPGLTPPDAVRATGEGVIVTRSHDMSAATVEVVRALVGPALAKPGSAAARAESERSSETGGWSGSWCRPATGPASRPASSGPGCRGRPSCGAGGRRSCCCRPTRPRASSSTTWWWSSRRRSWPSRSGGCARCSSP